MPEQLPKEVKQARGQELARVEAELQAEYFAKLRGKHLRVLVESPLENAPQWSVGTSCRYATVELPRELASYGEFVDVTAGDSHDGRIQAVE